MSTENRPWDLAVELQEIQLSTSQLAKVAGLSVVVLRNMIDRYGLFAEKRAGSGAHFSFNLRDVFTAAGIAGLIAGGGLSGREAVQALRPYSIYGAYLHNHEHRSFVLSRTARGQWAGFKSPTHPVSINIDLDALWSTFRDRLAAEVGEELVTGFEKAIELARKGERPAPQPEGPHGTQ